MPSSTITLNGSRTAEDVYAICSSSRMRVRIAPSSLVLANQTRGFLEKVSTRKIIYGINTGFGPMASHIIGRSEIKALQVNLIRGHAMGMGNPLPENYLLAAMVVRLILLPKDIREYLSASSAP